MKAYGIRRNVKMTRIDVYDVDAKTLEDICDSHDITTAELIEAVVSALEDRAFDLEDYI